MAGRGPAPKDPSKRAGHSPTDPVPHRSLVLRPSPQPDLPTFEIEKDGELREFAWPARTQVWWRMWGESPISADFTDTDWSFLLDTAILHARYWRGDSSIASELRLRMAKYGATPEDRSRLRIIATAEPEPEPEPAEPGATGSRTRRGPLTSLPGGKASGQ